MNGPEPYVAQPKPYLTHPKGTDSELRDIATWLDPDCDPQQAIRLAVSIKHISIFLLSELHTAADRRTARDEMERYKRIKNAARDLRLALVSRAHLGALLGPLAKLRYPRLTSTDEANSAQNNVDIAYELCRPWGRDDAHPLYFIEQIAATAINGLDRVTHAGGGTLHDQLRGDPQTALSLACGRLLVKQMREPPNKSATGQLYKLMTRVWKYATGEEGPASLGYHAKKGASKIRDELEPS